MPLGSGAPVQTEDVHLWTDAYTKPAWKDSYSQPYNTMNSRLNRAKAMPQPATNIWGFASLKTPPDTSKAFKKPAVDSSQKVPDKLLLPLDWFIPQYHGLM